MQLMSYNVLGHRGVERPWVPALRWLLAIAICLQLIGVTQHNHDIKGAGENCIGCYISVHADGGVQPDAPPRASAGLFLSYLLPSLPVAFTPSLLHHYFSPPSHAPPRTLL
ncbi:MAG: hypothetical protein V4443_11825 [Pseudomonadota bacterium]